MNAVSAIALLGLLLLVACSTGSSSVIRSPGSPAAPPRAGFNLRGLPTGTPGPPAEGALQAAGYASAALAALPAGAAGTLQLLVPQLFRNASTLDFLRLSRDVGAPADTVASRLQGLGWSWLVSEDGIEGGNYWQWRIEVLGFAEAGGADRYLAQPFLLPPALAEGSTADVPAGTRLLRTADSLVPLSNPALELDGERAVLLWRRGLLIFQVIESLAPAPVDLNLLAQLASSIDQRHHFIAGGNTP